jgi:phosphatidylserine/phosphatidylglycerophosphate/cardiolipin synthase-like enzyme
MSRQSRSNKPDGGNRSPVATIGGLIILIVLVIIGRLTGVDLTGGSGTPVPATLVPATASARPTNTARPPTAVRPTSAPATQVVNATEVASVPGGVTNFTLPLGIGARKGFWEVYFTAPSGSRDAKTYKGGIDEALAAAINKTRKTLDIVAFEFNSPALTAAVLDAHGRGVKVRMVTDTEHGLEDDDATTPQLVKAGIPVVDDKRSAFMHDKFMILDSTVVWMGSWNFTINDTYRNNNNALALRSQKLVQNYQAEFNEMFEQKQFGPRSPSTTPNTSFTQDGIPIQNYFAPEDEDTKALRDTLAGAKRRIRFMAFSFTLQSVSNVLLEQASAGVKVEGIFERVGSETDDSQLTRLFCANLPVRQDGSSFVLHHKVFIVDTDIVITGSFNFSTNAAASNDDNILIIQDRDLAAQYIAEYDRRWKEAKEPDKTKLSRRC